MDSYNDVNTQECLLKNSTKAKQPQEASLWKRLTFISDLLGGEIFASSILTSPGGILFKHWSGSKRIERGHESSPPTKSKIQDCPQAFSRA